MKAAIYARVSTDRQENKNQLDQLREFAKKQDWDIVREFVDTVSGSGKQSRPAFEQMMLWASQRKFDVLLFWKLDRFSREGVRQNAPASHQARSLWRWLAFVYRAISGLNGHFQGRNLVHPRDLGSARTHCYLRTYQGGLIRARKAGRKLGRPEGSVSVVLKLADIERMQKEGLGLRTIARKLGCSVNTVQRVRHCNPSKSTLGKG
jgi:DNA invertase Pin-like site-specific DNA recombinase